MKRWLTRLTASRTRTVANLSVLGVASAAFIVVATNADGYKATNIDVNDGSVWVSDTGRGRVGRLNVVIDEMDFDVTTSPGPDVLQVGRSIVAVDSGGAATIDPITGGYAQPTNGIPVGAYQVGGTTGLVFDAATGNLWTGRASSIVAPEYPDGAHGRVAPGAKVVVSASGRGYVVEPDAGRWFEVLLDNQSRPIISAPVLGTDVTGTVPTTDDAATVDPPATDTSVPEPGPLIVPTAFTALTNPVSVATVVTTVGEQLVFLDPDGSVYGPTGAIAHVPGGDWAIQPPGTDTAPRPGTVLVASSEGLFEITIGSDSVDQIAHNTGHPAQPVRVGRCAYGAWSAEVSSYYTSCQALENVSLNGVGPGDTLVWRVNQGNVALNSTGNGGVWAVHDGRLSE
ncbi:MAG TPA: hypothetical protein PLV68_12730, partial [Ilumatobacteraceae bacterium]|nr:hypothetical protein [Ilumatobacteraceae bacterium]